jgi:hypothetical protein
MTTLNTKDFTDSYKALTNAKYPMLNANEHLVLSTILTVSMEWEKKISEVQDLLDKMTKEQNRELQILQEIKAGKK